MSSHSLSAVSNDLDRSTLTPRLRAVASCPTYPPDDSTDARRAHIALFPRIQTMSSPPEQQSASSSSSAAVERSPSSSSRIEMYTFPPPAVQPVTLPPIVQPSPRVARIDKVKGTRAERSIRSARKDASGSVIASSPGTPENGGAYVTTPRRAYVSRATSPNPPHGQLPSLVSLGLIERRSSSSPAPIRPEHAPSPNLARQPAMPPRLSCRSDLPRIHTQLTSTSEHRHQSADGGFRPYRLRSPDFACSPASVGGRSAAGSSSAASSYAGSAHGDRFGSPLSQESSSPPRTPSPALPERYPAVFPNGDESADDCEMTDELIDDDDDLKEPLTAVPAPETVRDGGQIHGRRWTRTDDPAGYVVCRWNDCGAMFVRPSPPPMTRKSYAPNTRAHYAVLQHFRMAHGIDFGASEQKVPCGWSGCRKMMIGKSFTRHLLDSHMHLEAHRCDACGLAFSRQDALTRHFAKCRGKATPAMRNGGVRHAPGSRSHPWAAMESTLMLPPMSDHDERLAHARPGFLRASSDEPLAQVVRRGRVNKGKVWEHHET